MNQHIPTATQVATPAPPSAPAAPDNGAAGEFFRHDKGQLYYLVRALIESRRERLEANKEQ